MSADITLVFKAHAHCGGVVINNFKQALHLAVATAEYNDVVGIGEVGHMVDEKYAWINLKRLGGVPFAAIICSWESLSTESNAEAKSTKHITVVFWRLQRCSSVRRSASDPCIHVQA